MTVSFPHLLPLATLAISLNNVSWFIDLHGPVVVTDQVPSAESVL